MKHTPQEKRREQTKAQLIAAAINLFSSKGYYPTTSKDIAKEAHVSIGSFYTYYKDKKEILLEILQEFIEDALKAPMPDLDEEGSKNTIEALIKHLASAHHFSQGFYEQVTLLSHTDPDIGQVYDQYYQMMIQRISHYIKAMSPSLDPKTTEVKAQLAYALVEKAIHLVQFEACDEAVVYKTLESFLHQK